MYVAFSTVSSHRQARRSPRAPPAGGVANEHVLTLQFNRVVIKSGTDTLKNDCHPHCIPNIIGLEYSHSDDACMPLDQSGQLLPLIVACKVCIWINLERSTMPLDQGVLPVFWPI